MYHHNSNARFVAHHLQFDLHFENYFYRLQFYVNFCVHACEKNFSLIYNILKINMTNQHKKTLMVEKAHNTFNLKNDC